MFTIHPEVKYENASPEQKTYVRDMIKKDVLAQLSKELPSFSLSMSSSYHSYDLKCHIVFPQSLYLDLCRELLSSPFCFKYKGFNSCEVTFVQNAVKVDTVAPVVAVPTQNE
jgi:hypothetical protein